LAQAILAVVAGVLITSELHYASRGEPRFVCGLRT